MRDLNAEERSELLGIARRTLEQYLENQRTPVAETDSQGLLDQRGAFVTLHRGDNLRGCIGTFEAKEPLVNTVQRMAVAAATSDPRFPKVEPDELPELHVEISALTPLREADSDEIEVGTHGVLISRGPHRGVLLPQVAIEHAWDRETFLAHTCIKAGLKRKAWQDANTRIEVFTAEVFSEPR